MSSVPKHASHLPISHRDELVAELASGCKPREAWRVGTEHEKFGFRRCNLQPIPYEGEAGIRTVLEEMSELFGWELVHEGENPIALTKDGGSITLEPGGQVELSGAPLATIHETQAEIRDHLSQLATVCRSLRIAFLGIGTQPKWNRDQIHWMPKGRYATMRAYLPTKGSMSLDMMTRTGTVQANLDFATEGDMVAKFRVALALQPLASALFANSPFLDGQPTGFLSQRMVIWRHTDPDRCGWLPFVFEDGFGFERYVDYALDVPMFFIHRDEQYLPAHGQTFRRFLDQGWHDNPEIRPTLADWALHLTTLFPDVRLKRFLEMRGADAGNSATLTALPALWKGILYDEEARAAAWELVKEWTPEEREEIHARVPKMALRTPIPRLGTLRDLAWKILEIARDGLWRQDCRDARGQDESIYLDPLFFTAESGKVPAQWLLEAFHGRWQGSVDPLFREEAFESFIADCDGE